MELNKLDLGLLFLSVKMENKYAGFPRYPKAEMA